MAKKKPREPVPGESYRDRYGFVVCMAVANNWVMARRPRCTPFTLSVREWHERKEREPLTPAGKEEGRNG